MKAIWMFVTDTSEAFGVIAKPLQKHKSEIPPYAE